MAPASGLFSPGSRRHNLPDEVVLIVELQLGPFNRQPKASTIFAAAVYVSQSERECIGPFNRLLPVPDWVGFLNAEVGQQGIDWFPVYTTGITFFFAKETDAIHFLLRFSA
jgi:hypothetical protein